MLNNLSYYNAVLNKFQPDISSPVYWMSEMIYPQTSKGTLWCLSGGGSSWSKKGLFSHFCSSILTNMFSRINATRLDICHPYLAVAFITSSSKMVIKAVQIWIITAFLEIPIKVFICSSCLMSLTDVLLAKWQKSIETRCFQLSNPLQPLSVCICFTNFLDDMWKQCNITHERGVFFVQTQSNYFGQKLKPLSFYLGRYWFVIVKIWKEIRYKGKDS